MLGPPNYTHAQPFSVFTAPPQGGQFPRGSASAVEVANLPQAGPVLTPHGWISENPVEMPNTTIQGTTFVNPPPMLHLIGAPPVGGGYYSLPTHPNALYYIPHPTNIPPPNHMSTPLTQHSAQLSTATAQFTLPQSQDSTQISQVFMPLTQGSENLPPYSGSLLPVSQMNPRMMNNNVFPFRLPSSESQNISLAGGYNSSNGVAESISIAAAPNSYAAEVAQREKATEVNKDERGQDINSLQAQRPEEKRLESQKNIEIMKSSSKRPVCRTKVTVFKDVSVDTDFNDAVAFKSMAELPNSLYIEGLCTEDDVCDSRTGSRQQMNIVNSSINDKGTSTSHYSDSGFSSPTRSSVSSTVGDAEASVIYSSAATGSTFGTSCVVSGIAAAAVIQPSADTNGNQNQSYISSSDVSIAGLPNTDSALSLPVMSNYSATSHSCQNSGITTASAGSHLSSPASIQSTIRVGGSAENLENHTVSSVTRSGSEALEVVDGLHVGDGNEGLNMKGCNSAPDSNIASRGSVMNVAAASFVSSQFSNGSQNLPAMQPTGLITDSIEQRALNSNNAYCSASANQVINYSGMGGVYQQGPSILIDQSQISLQAGMRFAGPQYFLRFPTPVPLPTMQDMQSSAGLTLPPPNFTDMAPPPGAILSSQYVQMPNGTIQAMPPGLINMPPVQYMVPTSLGASQSQQYISVPTSNITHQSHLTLPPQYSTQSHIGQIPLQYVPTLTQERLSQIPPPHLVNNSQFNQSTSTQENSQNGFLSQCAVTFDAVQPGVLNSAATKVPQLNDQQLRYGQNASDPNFLPNRYPKNWAEKYPNAGMSKPSGSSFGPMVYQPGSRSSSRGRPVGRVEAGCRHRTSYSPAGAGSNYSRGAKEGEAIEGKSPKVVGLEKGGASSDRVLPFLSDNEFPQLLSAAGGLVAQSSCLTAGTSAISSSASMASTAVAMTYSDILRTSSNYEQVSWSGRSSLSGSDRTMSVQPGTCLSELSPGFEGFAHHANSSGLRDMKLARKKQKRQELADQAADEELAEISLEQQVLKGLGSKRLLKSATGLLGRAPEQGASNLGSSGHHSGPGPTGVLNQGSAKPPPDPRVTKKQSLLGPPPGAIHPGAFTQSPAGYSFNMGTQYPYQVGFPPGVETMFQGLPHHPLDAPGGRRQGFMMAPTGTGCGAWREVDSGRRVGEKYAVLNVMNEAGLQVRLNQ